jgi:hypothetical protein
VALNGESLIHHPQLQQLAHTNAGTGQEFDHGYSPWRTAVVDST